MANTETEARFIYIVATHSGYFTARQFLCFAGAKRGKRSDILAEKLIGNRHASAEMLRKNARVYHIFSRKIYAPIGMENVRNRRGCIGPWRNTERRTLAWNVRSIMPSDYEKFQQRIFDEMNELKQLSKQKMLLDFIDRAERCGIDLNAEFDKGRSLLEIAREVNRKLRKK